MKESSRKIAEIRKFTLALEKRGCKTVTGFSKPWSSGREEEIFTRFHQSYAKSIGATSGTGTFYPSLAIEFTTGFKFVLHDL